VQRWVNTFEFIASLATKCDVYLDAYGLKGALEHDCVLFLQEFEPAQEGLMAVQDELLAGEDQAMQSGDPELRRQWRDAGRSLNRSMDRILKTVNHLKFLDQAEQKHGKRRKK
jgi:hypothetical protein